MRDPFRFFRFCKKLFYEKEKEKKMRHFLDQAIFIFNLCMKVIILNLLLKYQRFVGDAGVLQTRRRLQV